MEGEPLRLSWAETLAALKEDGSLRKGVEEVEGVKGGVLGDCCEDDWKEEEEFIRANAGGGWSKKAVIRSYNLLFFN